MKSKGHKPLTTGRFKTRDALERNVLKRYAVPKKLTHKEIANKLGTTVDKVQHILSGEQSKNTPRELIKEVRRLGRVRGRLTLAEIGEECGISFTATRDIIQHHLRSGENKSK